MTTRVLLTVLAVAFSAIARSGERFGVEAIPICYNFGCNTLEVIAITPQEWGEASGWFAVPAATPDQERRQIQQAVGWLEVIAGRYTPIHRDLGLNNLDHGRLGQMDCIDESMNTMTFLRLLEQYGLLRHHRVLDRAYRRTMWDQHWAGQIEELASGDHWVVDSWFQDFGKLPYLQRTEDWKRIPFFFTSYIDNSPD